MSISDLYASGQHKRDLGHFANIVKLALSDEVLEEHEQAMLDRLARKLNLSEGEVKEIMKNPDKFPINPPVNYDARIERLYRLTKMMYADGHVDDKQVKILHKIAVGIGFPTDKADAVSDEAIKLVLDNIDLDTFTEAIKKVK